MKLPAISQSAQSHSSDTMYRPIRHNAELCSATFVVSPWHSNQNRARIIDMFRVEVEQEADGRWLAEVPDLSGVMTYGTSRHEAVTRAQALALRVLADRLDHGEELPQVEAVFSVVA